MKTFCKGQDNFQNRQYKTRSKINHSSVILLRGNFFQDLFLAMLNLYLLKNC